MKGIIIMDWLGSNPEKSAIFKTEDNVAHAWLDFR